MEIFKMADEDEVELGGWGGGWGGIIPPHPHFRVDELVSWRVGLESEKIWSKWNLNR